MRLIVEGGQSYERRTRQGYDTRREWSLISCIIDVGEYIWPARQMPSCHTISRLPNPHFVHPVDCIKPPDSTAKVGLHTEPLNVGKGK